MKKTLAIILLPLLAMGCAAQQSEVVHKIAATELKTVLKDEVQLVDVRTPSEFAGGHISNALNIDINNADFDAKIQQLDKSKPVYIYCQSGKRSSNAARRMESLGFTKIYDLKGGIMSWNGNKFYALIL